MKERFGLLRLKADGSPAKLQQVPAMHVLHTHPLFKAEWVDYSALDAKVGTPGGRGAGCAGCARCSLQQKHQQRQQREQQPQPQPKDEHWMPRTFTCASGRCMSSAATAAKGLGVACAVTHCRRQLLYTLV
jgi:hypothetical protein